MRAFDVDNSGAIDASEFWSVVSKFRMLTCADAIDRIVQEVRLRRGLVVEVIHALDINHDGHVSVKELDVGLQRLGVALKQTDLNLLFDFFDKDGSGEISVAEFYSAISGLAETGSGHIVLPYENQVQHTLPQPIPWLASEGPMVVLPALLAEDWTGVFRVATPRAHDARGGGGAPALDELPSGKLGVLDMEMGASDFAFACDSLQSLTLGACMPLPIRNVPEAMKPKVQKQEEWEVEEDPLNSGCQEALVVATNGHPMAVWKRNGFVFFVFQNLTHEASCTDEAVDAAMTLLSKVLEHRLKAEAAEDARRRWKKADRLLCAPFGVHNHGPQTAKPSKKGAEASGNVVLVASPPHAPSAKLKDTAASPTRTRATSPLKMGAGNDRLGAARRTEAAVAADGTENHLRMLALQVEFKEVAKWMLRANNCAVLIDAAEMVDYTVKVPLEVPLRKGLYSVQRAIWSPNVATSLTVLWLKPFKGSTEEDQDYIDAVIAYNRSVEPLWDLVRAQHGLAERQRLEAAASKTAKAERSTRRGSVVPDGFAIPQFQMRSGANSRTGSYTSSPAPSFRTAIPDPNAPLFQPGKRRTTPFGRSISTAQSLETEQLRSEIQRTSWDNLNTVARVHTLQTLGKSKSFKVCSDVDVPTYAQRRGSRSATHSPSSTARGDEGELGRKLQMSTATFGVQPLVFGRQREPLDEYSEDAFADTTRATRPPRQTHNRSGLPGAGCAVTSPGTEPQLDPLAAVSNKAALLGSPAKAQTRLAIATSTLGSPRIE